MKPPNLNEFQPDPRNANKGNDRGRKMLRESLRKAKAGRSILVDKKGVVIAGNKTREAAIAEGLTDAVVVKTDGSKVVVVQRTDLDLEVDEEAKYLAIADNRTAEIGLEWEPEVLADIREEVDLSGLWTDIELDHILSGLNEADGKGDGNGNESDDDFENELLQVAEGKIPSRVKPGEVWAVGGQKILCGDCRIAASFQALLLGRTIDLCVTSPPYAQQRSYDKTSLFEPIPAEDYVNWYAPIATNIKANLSPQGSYFLNIKEHSEDYQRNLYVKDLTIAHVREWGWIWLDEFVWTHSGIPGSPQKMGKFKNQWEPIFWFALSTRPKFLPQRVAHDSDETFTDDDYQRGLADKQGRSRLMGDRPMSEGKAYPGNVLSLGKNNEMCGHPAAFPVSLPEFFIHAYTDAGDIVFDPFLGSGSTLIAAEKNNRAGLGIELSPAYCEVVLRRLEELTKEEASCLNTLTSLR